MKELPVGFAGAARRHRTRLAGECVEHLLDEWDLIVEIEPHWHGKPVRLTQPRKYAGLQQRGLAQSRRAVDHGDQRLLDQREKLDRIGVAAAKVGGVALRERRQSQDRKS